MPLMVSIPEKINNEAIRTAHIKDLQITNAKN